MEGRLALMYDESVAGALPGVNSAVWADGRRDVPEDSISFEPSEPPVLGSRPPESGSGAALGGFQASHKSSPKTTEQDTRAVRLWCVWRLSVVPWQAGWWPNSNQRTYRNKPRQNENRLEKTKQQTGRKRRNNNLFKKLFGNQLMLKELWTHVCLFVLCVSVPWLFGFLVFVFLVCVCVFRMF